MSDYTNVFLQLVNALGESGRSIVPDGDAEDLRNGATHIPGSVTDARRVGRTVTFTKAGSRKDWYWTLPNGEKIFHG